MSYEQIMVTTRDGDCPVHVFTAGGAWRDPAIIFYMDAGGIRPAVLAMAERLSNAGYVVLLPDLFYRHGAYGPYDPVEIFAGDVAAILGPLIASTSNAKAAEDTAALLAYLDTRSDIASDKVGAVGFCMGGGMALVAAATHPDRFSAVASFHGGNLAIDTLDSPHGYASTLTAELYIAAAEDDPHYPALMAERFERALTDAHVHYRAETYPAAHGWMKPDFPVYDDDAAEHGWREMLALFERALC